VLTVDHVELAITAPGDHQRQAQAPVPILRDPADQRLARVGVERALIGRIDVQLFRGHELENRRRAKLGIELEAVGGRTAHEILP
jgi:hypothetical protein